MNSCHKFEIIIVKEERTYCNGGNGNTAVDERMNYYVMFYIIKCVDRGVKINQEDCCFLITVLHHLTE